MSMPRSSPNVTPSTNQSPGTAPSSRSAATDQLKKPSFEQIQMRAYALWLKKGQPNGSASQDWLEAEQELIRELNGTAKPGTKGR